MPYQFDRLDTATTPDQLMTLLPNMERRQYDNAQYIAVQCYRTAAGPPMSRGKASPWYEDFNPDQLYLPFEGFQPVEVQSIISNFSPEPGEGWAIQYTPHNSDRCREVTFHERQTFAPNRILSLSLFERVQVDGGASRPFVQPSQSGVLPSTPRSCVGLSTIARELSELLQRRAVREALQNKVANLEEINQPVALGSDGIFYAMQDGSRVAKLISAIDTHGELAIQFRIRLPDSLRIDFIVTHREISRLETRLEPSLTNVGQIWPS